MQLRDGRRQIESDIRTQIPARLTPEIAVDLTPIVSALSSRTWTRSATSRYLPRAKSSKTSLQLSAYY